VQHSHNKLLNTDGIFHDHDFSFVAEFSKDGVDAGRGKLGVGGVCARLIFKERSDYKNGSTLVVRANVSGQCLGT